MTQDQDFAILNKKISLRLNKIPMQTKLTYILTTEMWMVVAALDIRLGLDSLELVLRDYIKTVSSLEPIENAFSHTHESCEYILLLEESEQNYL